MSNDPGQFQDGEWGARLKGLYPLPGVPGEREREILGMAGRHWGMARRRMMMRRMMWGGAVAAGLMMAVWVGWGIYGSGADGAGREVARSVPSLEGADIRDAYYLARKIKAGVHDAAWDVNHDGVVDQKDVDALGAAAVRLTNHEDVKM